MNRSSQPSSMPKRKPTREACNAKSRKSLFHFKPEKVNRFEYCDKLWKQNIFYSPVRKLKACFYNNQHAVCAIYVYANHVNLREGKNNCYKSLPKHKTIIEDLDNIIQELKTVRLGL